MKDHFNPKNYREKYKRHYGIDFGKEYHVHHIDGDRSNNDIDNLILLPSELHRMLHHAADELNMSSEFVFPIRASSVRFKHLFFMLGKIEEYENVFRYVNNWVMFKDIEDTGGDVYGCVPGIEKL